MRLPDGLLRTTVRLVVPFQDADPAGVAWHGNYFRYFDMARCALLEKLDYGYRSMQASGYLWPIVDTRVRYIRPIAYDQPIAVTAWLVEWQYRLKIGYEILTDDGQRCTEAYTIQVAVASATGEMAMEVPEFLRRRIEACANP